MCIFVYMWVFDLFHWFKHWAHPVGWGCRIRRLHLCRGVRPPLHEATCWLWAVTCKALGWNPGGWTVIDPATEWSMACNTSLWPLLGLTGGQIGPDPINQLVLTCPSTYVWFSPDRIMQSALVELLDLLLWNYSKPFIPYMLEGGGWGSIVLRGRTYECS